LSLILDVSHVQEYSKGETICREGEPARTVWLVFKGEAELVRHTTRGQVLLIDMLLPDAVFGVVFYSDNPVQPVSVFTLKPTRVLHFPLSLLLDELQGNSSLRAALLEDKCLKLCHSIALRGMALKEVPVWLASILWRLHEKFCPFIPETRATLDELAGTTTESVIRITRELEKQGILRLGRGKVEILLPEKLQQLSALDSTHHHHQPKANNSCLRTSNFHLGHRSSHTGSLKRAGRPQALCRRTFPNIPGSKKNKASTQRRKSYENHQSTFPWRADSPSCFRMRINKTGAARDGVSGLPHSYCADYNLRSQLRR